MSNPNQTVLKRLTIQEARLEHSISKLHQILMSDTVADYIVTQSRLRLLASLKHDLQAIKADLHNL